MDIIKSFNDLGYIIGLNNVEELEEALKIVNDFNPKEYIKNTGNIIEIVANFIDNN